MRGSKMKNILITGASRGIGAAIAKELAAPGCALFLHYYQSKESIIDVSRECEQRGALVHIIQADLSQATGAKTLLDALYAQIDIVIHNGGTSRSELFTELTNEALEELINIHLLNPMKITRELLPHMIREKRGKIIAISSIWGLTGAACEVGYSAAKGGLNTFIKSLAKEVAMSNIQINGVAPGAILTDMLSDYSNEDIQSLEMDIPAGTLGQPQDIADAVAFLCSDKSNYINGQILSVNGAWYC
jgi:3-oxoacyl-[acyl-carrier protein] reductase